MRTLRQQLWSALVAAVVAVIIGAGTAEGARPGVVDQGMYCSNEYDDPNSVEYAKCSSAIEQVRRTLETRPADVATLLELARYQENRSRAEAMKLYAKVLELDANSFEAHFRLGALEENAQDKIKHLAEAARINPGDLFVHGMLATALLAQRKSHEAARQALLQIKLNPGSEFPVSSCIRELMQQGAAEDARKVLDAYLASALPERERCSEAMAGLAVRLGSKSSYAKSCSAPSVPKN
jgi:tetratricopeptide (TPR) repeat protein